ncbi:MAG: hypothetical protein GY853_01445 [PVC group bacterium]|nr:hypothetical protein [PVC group bacterium]
MENIVEDLLRTKISFIIDKHPELEKELEKAIVAQFKSAIRELNIKKHIGVKIGEFLKEWTDGLDLYLDSEELDMMISKKLQTELIKVFKAINIKAEL